LRVEQGLPLIRVANTGITAVIDARGRVAAADPADGAALLEVGRAGVIDAQLPGALAPPPYARFGDLPLALLLMLACGLGFIRRGAAGSA
jgi:apolipoprotein N-acyltransferase